VFGIIVYVRELAVKPFSRAALFERADILSRSAGVEAEV
jgi:hypothetical protein